MNSSSALPRKLRTLLIAVDGKTELGTYITSLSSFGDVEALMQSLQHAGLIEVTSAQANAKHVQPAEQVSVSDNALVASWRTTDVGNSSWQSRSGRDTQPPVDDLLSWSNFQRMPVSPAASYNPPQARVNNTTAHHQLRKAVGLMSDFVTQHMPMESLELVLALEGLNSVEQVVASLKGYEALTSHLGDPARKHMAELRHVMSSF